MFESPDEGPDMWIAALLLACSGTPEAFEDCTSAACREAWIARAWNGDPASVVPAIEAIRDPIEQTVVVVNLVEAHPDRTSSLCQRLPRGSARERCKSITRRPHLWEAPVPPTSAATRPGGGPSSRSVVPVQGTRSSYADVAPHPPDCPSWDRACVVAAALEYARKREPEQAAATCKAIDEAKWSEECMFQVAERFSGAKGVKGYPAAADLCLLAGPYSAQCLTHLVVQHAREAPPANETRPQPWKALSKTVSTLVNTWTTRDPTYGAQVEASFWSEALGVAYAKVPEVNGIPLDHVPAEAVLHVRASAAWRLLQLEGDHQRDLAGWVERLSAALASREPHSPEPKPTMPFRGLADLWPEDVGDEQFMPAVVYMGASRRTWSADETTDLAICVLEAAARVEVPMEALLKSGADHEDAQVRWTARRLLERRGPEQGTP